MNRRDKRTDGLFARIRRFLIRKATERQVPNLVSARAMNLPNMTPYLVTAMLDYCRDNGFTPYVFVAVDDSCDVPQEYVTQNTIVFDVSDEAVHNFGVDAEALTFQARFGEANTIFHVHVPINRVGAVFPQEHPEMAFRFEVTATEKTEEKEADDTPPVRRPNRVK